MTEYNTLAEALDANKIKNAAQKKEVRKPQIGKAVEELTPEKINAKYYKRTHRTGKTARDHATGSHRATMTNRDVRGRYAQEKSPDAARGLLASCNGQKTRALRARTSK